MLKTTQLSQNIKFLRKRMQVSQQELANQLGIKRSNIAAYESKNIEPRLRVLLNMAKLFNIEFKMFLDQRLDNKKKLPAFKKDISLLIEDQKENLDIRPESVNRFIESSIAIRKILLGFKSLQALQCKNNTSKRLKINTFIDITEQLLLQNQQIIKSINNTKSSHQ